VVAVEGLFPWGWLAALCAQEGRPFVRGHALYMQASPGGQATNDQLDSQKIAALLRGGRLPQASVSPAQMRAPRDLLRRRTHLLRNRAELWAHGQQTHSQDHRPEIGQQLAYKATRGGVAQRFAAPAGQKSIAVDWALIPYDDQRLGDVELSLVQAAKHHEAHTLDLLQTVPGLGKSLRLVLL
jgi:hypothetical protein